MGQKFSTICTADYCVDVPVEDELAETSSEYQIRQQINTIEVYLTIATFVVAIIGASFVRLW